METPFWQIIGALVSIFLGYLAVSDFLSKKAQKHQDSAVQQVKTNSELELKVKALEGKIEAQYEELSSKLIGLERSLADSKTTNTAFENRIIQGVDKLDNKIEAIRDLVIKVVTNQK